MVFCFQDAFSLKKMFILMVLFWFDLIDDSFPGKAVGVRIGGKAAAPAEAAGPAKEVCVSALVLIEILLYRVYIVIWMNSKLDIFCTDFIFKCYNCLNY